MASDDERLADATALAIALSHLLHDARSCDDARAALPSLVGPAIEAIVYAVSSEAGPVSLPAAEHVALELDQHDVAARYHLEAARAASTITSALARRQRSPDESRAAARQIREALAELGSKMASVLAPDPFITAARASA